jgi:hypothetical protein
MVAAGQEGSNFIQYACAADIYCGEIYAPDARFGMRRIADYCRYCCLPTDYAKASGRERSGLSAIEIETSLALDYEGCSCADSASGRSGLSMPYSFSSATVID